MKVEARYGVVKDENDPSEPRWIVVAEFVSFPTEMAATVAANQLANATRDLFSEKRMLERLRESTASINGPVKH